MHLQTLLDASSYHFIVWVTLGQVYVIILSRLSKNYNSSQSFLRIFSEKNCLIEKIVDVARLIDSAGAQSSGQQRLNYVDGTHLVLASGKLVLQKIITDRQCVKQPFLSKLFGLKKSEWRQKWKSRPNMKEGAQGRGFDSRGRHHLSPTALKLKQTFHACW